MNSQSDMSAADDEQLSELIESCFDLRISSSGADITIRFRDRPITVNYETFLELRKKLEAVAEAWADKRAAAAKATKIKQARSLCGCPMCLHHTEPYEALTAEAKKGSTR